MPAAGLSWMLGWSGTQGIISEGGKKSQSRWSLTSKVPAGVAPPKYERRLKASRPGKRF
jgi:hypothetical protein